MEKETIKLSVEEIANTAINVFAEWCKEIARENWSEFQVDMLDTLFESARTGCDYKCVKCEYLGKAADAPETAPKECMCNKTCPPPCEEE